MKLLPFDLETALKHPERVVYRNCEKPFGWHWFEKTGEYVFCIASASADRCIETHTVNGFFYGDERESKYDLMLLPPPEKRYWVNVYGSHNNVSFIEMYVSEDAANSDAKLKSSFFIKTITFTI